MISTKISRLYNFIAGNTIRSAEVDAELDQIVTAQHDLVDDMTSTIADVTTTIAGKADVSYVDGVASNFVLGAVPDGSITVAKLGFDPATQSELDAHSADNVKHITSGERDSWNLSSDKGFNADLEYYYNTNVKPLGIFQTDETWVTVAGTQSLDTTNFKIGTQGLKILENDNVVGALNSYRLMSPAIDMTKFSDGSVSATSDYVRVVFYISDVTKIDTAAGKGVFVFCADTIPIVNMYYCAIRTGLVNGWNYVNVLKSDFLTQGAPSWSSVGAIQVGWWSLANSINSYITFSYVGMVRKDPAVATPNPFQRKVNNAYVREFAINSGEWFVGLEFGKVVCKDLAGASTGVQITGVNNYGDGAIVIASFKISGTNDTLQLIPFYTDASNYITAYTYSGTTILLRSRVAGVNSDVTKAFSHVAGDIITIAIKKKGSTFVMLAYKNNDITNAVELTIESTIASGYFSIFSFYSPTLYSFSITTLEHAQHASIAEVAKSVVNQSWEKINSIALLATATQIDFAVPSGYKAFKIVFNALSSTTTARDITIKLNDLVTTDYDTNRAVISATTITATTTAGGSSFVLTEGVSFSSAGVFSTGEITINNKPRPCINFFYETVAVANTYKNYVGGGSYDNTISGGISKISLIISADAFGIGTEFTLLGVK